MQAIILAGGFGTRLQKTVKNIPKPMAPIENKPFLFYLLSYLKSQCFTDIVISVHYLKEQIEQYLGNNFLGLNIKYAIEEEPLGTGGAILNSLKYIDQNKPLVILNGDTFLEINYQKLVKFYNDNSSDFTIALREIEDSSRYGSVEIDNSNLITNFAEKNIQKNSRYINGGVYILNSQIFSNYNLAKKFSFEQDFLCKYRKSIRPYGFVSKDYFIDIGVPKDYQKAQSEIPKRAKNKSLFLDRDGVVNIDYGHVGKIEDFDFIEGIFELCQKAQNAGYLIIIVTNQAGIAKGYYTEEQFLTLNNWMENEFKKKGIYITKTYYCPYHIDAKIAKYKKNSEDRKPNPGMILKAIKEFNIDPFKSIMIGDKQSDVSAGRSAGIKKIIQFKEGARSLCQISFEAQYN
jgi:D,D-heptose 1,7-bisphosphate phosphatase